MGFYILFAAILAVVAVGGVWAYFFTRKVKREGIETYAAVTRIDVNESEDSDGCVTRSKVYIVTYVDRDGQAVEATLSNPKNGLTVGSRIRIKYLPDRPEYPVLTEIL